MKKLILTVTALVGLANFATAQNYQQTVDWLKDNVGRIDHVNCPTIQLYGDNLEINENGVKLYDNAQSCSIEWTEIREVEESKDYIYLISEKTVDEKPIVLKFFINNQQDDVHFTEAFKYIRNINKNMIAKNN